MKRKTMPQTQWFGYQTHSLCGLSGRAGRTISESALGNDLRKYSGKDLRGGESLSVFYRSGGTGGFDSLWGDSPLRVVNGLSSLQSKSISCTSWTIPCFFRGFRTVFKPPAAS